MPKRGQEELEEWRQNVPKRSYKRARRGHDKSVKRNPEKPHGPRKAPTRYQVDAQDGFKRGPERSKTVQYCVTVSPKMASKETQQRPQEGSKRASKIMQKGPKTSPKMAQGGPKRLHRKAPRGLQRARRSLKTALQRSNMTSRGGTKRCYAKAAEGGVRASVLLTRAA